MTPQEILKTYPSKIARSSELSEEARNDWQLKKAGLEKLKAKVYLQTKALNTSFTISEVEATVEANEEIYAKKLEAIKAESEFRKHQSEANSMIESLNSAKIIARQEYKERNAGSYQ